MVQEAQRDLTPTQLPGLMSKLPCDHSSFHCLRPALSELQFFEPSVTSHPRLCSFPRPRVHFLLSFAAFTPPHPPLGLTQMSPAPGSCPRSLRQVRHSSSSPTPALATLGHHCLGRVCPSLQTLSPRRAEPGLSRSLLGPGTAWHSPGTQLEHRECQLTRRVLAS